MTGKNTTRERITPQEAIALFHHAGSEELQRAKALYDAYRAENEVRYPALWDNLDLWDLVSLLTFAYDTGKVQGIREERAKKAKKEGAVA